MGLFKGSLNFLKAYSRVPYKIYGLAFVRAIFKDILRVCLGVLFRLVLGFLRDSLDIL